MVNKELSIEEEQGLEVVKENIHLLTKKKGRKKDTDLFPFKQGHRSDKSANKRDLIIPDADTYDLRELSKKYQLPLQAMRLHGCFNCEWKDAGVCPFGYQSGRGHKLVDNVHKRTSKKDKNGTCGVIPICNKRIEWLLGFTNFESDCPVVSFNQWQRDFNSAMSRVQLLKDKFKLDEAERALAQADNAYRKALKDDVENCDEETHQKRIIFLNRSRWNARQEWERLTNMVQTHLGKDLDRVAKREIDITVSQKMNIDDFDRIVREGEAIEAEFTEKDKEDGEHEI